MNSVHVYVEVDGLLYKTTGAFTSEKSANSFMEHTNDIVPGNSHGVLAEKNGVIYTCLIGDKGIRMPVRMGK